jgi:hypothetical protein
MTKSTIYGLITTNDTITNYYIDDDDDDGKLVVVYRGGDDYDRVDIHNYIGVEFINTSIEISNYYCELDIIIKNKKLFTIDEIKDLLVMVRERLPANLIDYYYLDENLSLTLFFEFIIDEMTKNNASKVYINRE